MAITPDDKKISQMTEVAPSVGMFVPLVDLTQLPSSQNVRASVASILALVDLSGYVPTSRTITASGSLTGGGDLSSDRSLSLSGDNASPGNSQYYGTNGVGTKGFFPLPASGTGTVTSFSSGNLSPLFTTNVATATTTPALTFSLSTQSANLVFAGPTNGAAAAPTFRSLVAADIPSLSGVYQPLNANLTAISALTTTAYGLDFLELADAAAARAYIGAGTGSGSVTSVGLTMPSGFSVGGSPVTTTGTLAVTTTLSGLVVGDGSGLLARTATGTADRISIINGSGVAGNPTFDIASTYVGQTSITTLGTITTGTWSATTIAAARGGTGQTTYAEGDLLYGNGGGTLSKLPIQTLPGYFLLSGATPSWAQLSAAAVTGATGTANQVLVNGTSGSAQVGAITLTTPQDIATSSTPQFSRIGLGAAADSVAPLNIQKGTVSAETQLVKLGWTDDITSGVINAGISVYEDTFGSGGFTGVRFSASSSFGDAVPYQFYDSANPDFSVGINPAIGAIYFNNPFNGIVLRRTNSTKLTIYADAIDFRSQSALNLWGSITSTGINAAAIGATTPSTGAFTTLTSTGLTSFSDSLRVGPSAALVSGGRLMVNDSAVLGSQFSAWGGNVSLQSRRFNGTIGAETALQNGDNILNFGSGGYDGVAASGRRAGFFTTATQTWSAGNHGSSIRFFATGNGSATPTDDVATITSTGINATAIGATSPSTGAFTTISTSTANAVTATFGSAGVGSSATPTQIRMDGSFANSATPTNQQLKINLINVSSTEAYGFTVSSDAGVWYHTGDSASGTGAYHAFATHGAVRAIITTTGLNSTPIGATTPSTGAFTSLTVNSKAVTEGAADSGGTGFRVLRVPN